MKATCLARVGRFLLSVIVASPLVLLIFSSAYPAPDAMPEVLLLVDARSTAGAPVSINYPMLVEKEQATRDLHRLADSTGWIANNVTMSNESVMESGENPMTAVEFVTGPTVDWETGNLPIKQIVTAFKEYKSIQIVYMLPQGFPFAAVGDYEDKWVKITLASTPDTCSYRVTVKDSGFEELNLPEPARGGTDEAGRNKGGGLAIALVVILALVTAVVVFVVTGRLNKKHDQQQRS